MNKIPIEKLREMWQRDGLHGDWRKLLKEGYRNDELYFEFGLMPEKSRDCDYRIIIDHEVPVWLCDKDVNFSGEHVIKTDDEKAGEVEVFESTRAKGFRYHTYYVTTDEYQRMLSEAAAIHDDYKDPEYVSFWSIPQQWYGETLLIQFISDRIVDHDDFRNRLRGKQCWYWP